MIRTTIDFGIDLGTTNSSIAVLTEGRAQPIRNNEQQEITPSVVMVDKAGVVSVGKRAYQLADRRPASVVREFKRVMGTDSTFDLSGRVMTPEELSAEILKGLRADAQARLGEDVTAAVITVPAMFTLAACDATVRAARLAGINQSPLLQEPIAAGLAHGIQNDSAAGYWIVYDLGGGTFDASLMTLRQGRLQVIDHAGDEYLGGKNFDDALVDYVVSRLASDYQIEGIVRGGGSRHQLLYARIKSACEEAKIDLSRSERTTVEVVGVNDDQGKPIEMDLEVTRSTLEQLIEPLVSRTMRIVSDLLDRNGLKAETIQRVIPVGGPTLTPYIRKRLKTDTGIDLETRIDPMTVVAQGAALFAGSVLRETSPDVSPVAAGEVQLDLKYSPVTEETEALVGGRLRGAPPGDLHVQAERQDAGWNSGRVPVSNSTFVLKVGLEARRANLFYLRLFDRSGAQLAVRPNQFSITNGLVADEPPLSRSLGVAVDRGDDQPRTEFLLKRGTRLPANGHQTFRTIRSVVPGQPVGINIHLVEGESDRADRNDHVGQIRLDGTNIQRPLPVGSEVEVKFSVDTSRRLTVNAFVPLLDEGFDVIIEDLNRPVPAVIVLETQLTIEEERLATVGQVGTVGEARGLLGEAKGALEVARTGEKDAAMRAQKLLRELQGFMDRAADVASLPMLEAEWRDLLPRAREVITEYGDPGDRQRLIVLEREGAEALSAANEIQFKQRIEQLRDMYWATLTAQPGWWIGLYQELVERQKDMSNPSTARLLVQEGRRALDRQDFDSLRQTCTKLWNLLPSSERSGMSRGLPDVGVRV